ncbi:hypothetical protein AAIR98_001428 [Elusimicrobium simillimum]|uniref:hypothetical protein n=1 Tax=Elusimicrobium simillimum TaxID=3143438 RepID=UPI003C6F830E
MSEIVFYGEFDGNILIVGRPGESEVEIVSAAEMTEVTSRQIEKLIIKSTDKKIMPGYNWRNDGIYYIEGTEPAAPVVEPTPLEKIEALEVEYSLPRPVRDIFISMYEVGLQVPEKVWARVQEIETLAAQAETLRKEENVMVEAADSEVA